jgi:N-acetylneuraminic acid mutarotase
MAAIEDKIYLFGGGVWSSELGWTDQYSDTYVYNSVTNEWSAMQPDIKPPVSTYPYIFSVGTNVFIFGGASVEGNHV